MRILITGSRNWSDKRLIEEAFAEHINPVDAISREVTVIHGAARGADELCGRYAKYIGLKVEEYPANWSEHGKAAGVIRNQQMVDSGADLCLAFPMTDSIGTHDCIGRAERAGIPVYVYHPRS